MARRNGARIEETRGQLDRLRTAVCGWHDRRAKLDPREQFLTQLNTLRSVLSHTLDAIEREVAAITPFGPSGRVYEDCRFADRRLVFIEAYWEYFRRKWDQRDSDDDDLRRTLAAADEIVWSCYAGAFLQAGRPPASAPLPYIEPHFTPRAITRVDPPPDLRAHDALLRGALRELPLPTIGVPPVCVARPWWLIFIAHETGHHLAHDLLGDDRRAAFAAALDAAAGGSADGNQSAWWGWHEEVFADAFSVLSAGPAAAWALDELLETNGPAMLESDDSMHPSPVVRSATVAAVLDAVGLPPGGGVPRYGGRRPDEVAPDEDEAEPRRAAEQAIAVLPNVVAAIVEPLEDLGTLPELCAWQARRFEPGGRVAVWRDDLLGADEPRPEQGIAAAKLAISGALAAWAAVVDHGDEDSRPQDVERLADRVRATLPECRAPGTRAGAESAIPDVTPAVEGLSAALFGEELRARA